MRRSVLAIAMAAALGFAANARAVELEGFWYVLVHYQDAETGKPDQWRWDDRVWKFEKKGDRLEWSEWPIVVLDDESGRFEPVRGGRATRVLGHWEPSERQLADIRNGVQVNSRGAKNKTLRPESGGTSWSSGEGAAADSAMVVTYSETWTITGLPEAPVFARDDSMGSGVTESMSGRTVYTTETIGPNGDEIAGRFERDGTRTGRFKLIRAGGTEALKGAARDQQELQRKRFRESMANSEEMRALVRERVETDLAARGVTASEEEIEKLTQQAMVEAQQTGSADRTGEAVAEKAKELFFAFAPKDAKHDDTVRYLLPFDPSVPRQLGQGVGGDMGYDLYGNAVSSPQEDPASHVGRHKYGFDWGMPVGTTVVAARGGKVARVVDGSTQSGPAISTPGNHVYILHDDGTWGEYQGLDIGIPVRPGQVVEAGAPIGKARGSGSWRGGLGIHFAVGRLDSEGKPESLPILFADGGKGFVPVPGSYYGGNGGKATKADPPPGEQQPTAP
jgi:murein DD-endopeptidase MepM/ murein hydrolase activator NlpD